MRRIAAVVLALALFAAACSSGDEDVARVGGAAIRLSDVQALYEDRQPVDDEFRSSLFTLVALEAISQELSAEFGTAVPESAVDAYFAQFQAALDQSGSTPAELIGVENASLERLRLDARVAAVRDTALEQLVVAPATVDRLFADPLTMTRVCARHILVAERAEAEAAQARLAAGEDFAAVAGEVSLDTQSEGGDLGCTLAGDYVDEFARAAVDAPLGEVTGPVESEFGWHLILVSERTVPTRLDYLADPWEMLSNTQAALIWSDWITTSLLGADVWVNEDYGVWTGDGLEPPAAGTTTTTGG